MSFEAGNPFVEKVVETFVKRYDGTVWGHNGPRLLTLVAAEFSQKPQGLKLKTRYDAESRCTVADDASLHVLPRSVFYEQHYRSACSDLCRPAKGGYKPESAATAATTTTAAAHAVHAWHKMIGADAGCACRKFQVEASPPVTKPPFARNKMEHLFFEQCPRIFGTDSNSESESESESDSKMLQSLQINHAFSVPLWLVPIVGVAIITLAVRYSQKAKRSVRSYARIFIVCTVAVYAGYWYIQSRGTARIMFPPIPIPRISQIWTISLPENSEKLAKFRAQMQQQKLDFRVWPGIRLKSWADESYSKLIDAGLAKRPSSENTHFG